MSARRTEKMQDSFRADKGRSGVQFWFQALVVAMLLALLVEIGRTQADAPRDDLRRELLYSSAAQHPVRLTASDDGPFFSLEDLRAYVPPPPKPKAWEIRPPVWVEYPKALDDIPIVPRGYSEETIRYLAEHEIRQGDRSMPYVALTFDCELGTSSTRHILETLQAEGVRATFFVQGRYAYRNPEIMRQIEAGGHEFGNHSFFHPQFTSISPITATQELTYTEAAITWALGHPMPMRYIRFPYGRRNNATRLHAASLGYQSASWDIDPRGWDPEKGPEDVVEYIRRTAHPGGIVIMHCMSWDDAHALSDVIQVLRERGLEPGTLWDVLTEADRDVPGYPLSAAPNGGG